MKWGYYEYLTVILWLVITSGIFKYHYFIPLHFKIFRKWAMSFPDMTVVNSGEVLSIVFLSLQSFICFDQKLLPSTAFLDSHCTTHGCKVPVKRHYHHKTGNEAWFVWMDRRLKGLPWGTGRGHQFNKWKKRQPYYLWTFSAESTCNQPNRLLVWLRLILQQRNYKLKISIRSSNLELPQLQYVLWHIIIIMRGKVQHLTSAIQDISHFFSLFGKAITRDIFFRFLPSLFPMSYTIQFPVFFRWRT